MANRNKATHIGECQVCGARQKLPNGLLSKHGYTLDYGFFNGTCHGSGNVPFEISCDMVEASIVRATEKAAELRARGATLRTADYAGVTTAWVHHYQKAARYTQSGYVYREATLYPDEHFHGVNYTISPGEKYEVKGSFHEYSHDIKSMSELVRKLNSRYADHLETIAVKADEYVVWARKRVNNWAPKSLTEI